MAEAIRVEAEPFTALGQNDAPDLPCDSRSGNGLGISSKFGHGGPRANSGGPRANSGGRRPGAGRKPKPIVAPAYAPDTPHWAVVSFWGQAEISGSRELTRIGYENYVPLIAIRRRDPVIPTRWNNWLVPLFPGYGFIRITQTESRQPITETRGVRGVLLRPDGRLAYARDAEIDRFRRDDDARLLLPRETAPALAKGVVVRVEAGAFQEACGPVLECDGVRTCVELILFGGLRPVWLDRTAVVEI